MQSKKLFAVCLLALMAACKPKEATTVTDHTAEADSLAQALIIADTHIDLPELLHDRGFDGSPRFLRSIYEMTGGNFDIKRAKEGGLNAPFMSIYIPSDRQKLPDKGKSLADSLIDMVELIVKAYPQSLAQAGTPADITNNFKAGKISMVMGMENGAPIGMDLANLQYFYNRGIRYITLTHFKDNQICDSSFDPTGTWNGLSPFGKKVVAEMNRLGIMVDISHVSDSTFYQVMRITKAPVIASHSSCRYFRPGFERDMSDDMLKQLAKNGGVIQINFDTDFLDSTVASYAKEHEAKLHALLKAAGVRLVDSAAAPIIQQFRKDNPQYYTDVKRVADHIDHVVKLIGIDHVGIGSDFDGVDDEVPFGISDVSMYPNLIRELLDRGYTPEDIQKICSGNLFRVWGEVIKVAG